MSKWLESKEGWSIKKTALGKEKGVDILAEKNGEFLIIEAKGAKSGEDKPIREEFDSGQIKDHMGKAIVKILEERHKCESDKRNKGKKMVTSVLLIQMMKKLETF